MMAVSFTNNQIIVRQNNALSPLANVKILVIMATLALIVALSFWKIGAWLVLPFAGLELLSFAIAFHFLTLHANDFESITVLDETVVVEKYTLKKSTKAVFQLYWAQVNLRKKANGMNALFVGSHGKEVEFGRGFINDEQRSALVKEIRLIIKNNYPLHT